MSNPKSGDTSSQHTSNDWRKDMYGRLYNARTGQFAPGSGGGILTENEKGHLESK